MAGHTNNVGDVTLDANQATTAVTDQRVNVNSAVILVPTSANALADVVGTGVYVSSIGDDTFTITHPNNANADKTFKYVIVG